MSEPVNMNDPKAREALIEKLRWRLSPLTRSNFQSALDLRGEIFMTLIQKGAFSMKEKSPYDGQASLRTMTPDEVVEHAREVTEKAFAVLADKGWAYDSPSLEEQALSHGQFDRMMSEVRYVK